MSYAKEIAIKNTFTYDKELDEIGWIYPEAHNVPKPIIHKAKSGRRDYCVGRGRKIYSVEMIKEILGGSNERRHIQRLS